MVKSTTAPSPVPASVAVPTTAPAVPVASASVPAPTVSSVPAPSTASVPTTASVPAARKSCVTELLQDALSCSGSVSSGSVVLKKKSCIVDYDEYGEPLNNPSVPSVPTTCEIPLTQVHLKELKADIADIAEVEELMSPPPKKESAIQAAICELCEVVHELKRKLQSREHDILYYRSIENDHDKKLQRLRDQLKILRDELCNLCSENLHLKRENAEFNRILSCDRSNIF